MRNRAKCKLCLSVIESLHETDLQSCECKQIAIEGGESLFKAYANDFNNFLRIDDDGKEHEVKVVDKPEEIIDFKPPLLTKEDLLKELDMLCDEADNLPENAMRSFVTQYDLYRIAILMRAILRAE